MGLADPIAVVTGASRGIGRVIAQRLSATHRVVAMARSAERLDELAAECGAVPVVVDVADEASVAEAWARVQHDVGNPDLLVNNAGICEPSAPVWDQPPDEWWRVFEVNVRGTFLLTRAALPAMLDAGHGRIVNVASNAGFFQVWDGVGDVDCSAYMASKAAVIRLSEVVAGETTGTGVAVFAISPGTVKTAMTAGNRSFVEMWDDDSVWAPAEAAADLVAFLASGELDELSGRYIHAVNDDWRSMARRAAHIAAADEHTLRVGRS